MEKWNVLTVAATLCCLAACGGDGIRDDYETEEDEIVTITFDEFVDEVSASSGDEAVDCGIVEIGASDVDANTCVAQAFVDGQSFFSVYELQGFDSNVGAALSGDSDGKVFRWTYDSNPSGATGSSSEIDTTECVDAELSGSLDSGYADVFSCAQND